MVSAGKLEVKIILKEEKSMEKQEQVPSGGFLNQSELEFDDISSEFQRVYVFPNGQKLRINEPLFLNVSKSGGHRLFSADGYCWYIQPREGWYIRWVVKEGQPHFVR